ncbi:Transposase IS200 like protein [Polystyrenella longa]|uniref:Transposase IS200 like protein n=1 Tax=Polystyrenella longa TaxID=2528007 RepID=A0A518CGT9_9PLAN|nr:transposase [Polystyrenella longa]QDU78439.1 Transposase IS200 like protein [Polystyrenella longa]
MNDITHPHRRRIFSEKLYAHFVTTSCYDRRMFFSIERAAEIFQWALTSQAEKQNAHLIGYVIMPEHVHFIIWFPEPGQLSNFMKHLK